MEVYFFICLTIAFIGILGAALNMIFAVKKGLGGNFKNVFVYHILAGLCYGLGGLGMVVFGILWLVQYLKS